MPSSATATVTLPTDTQILITREFDAPVHLVYRACTEPELVSRWWPGRRGTMTSCEIDLRIGGRWRYVMTATGGFEVAFHGEYREIDPAVRTVSTEVFEGFPDGESVNTARYLDLGEGRTRLEILVQHSCREHRDAHIGSGMEDGMQEGMDLLEELAISLDG